MTAEHDPQLAIDGGTPVRATPLDFSPPLIGDEEVDSVVATLRSGWLTSGPRVAELEQRFAAYAEVPYAIATSSCTAALHLALIAADVGAGDEVVTTSFTWPATVNAILHAGAQPVFADVDRATLNIDPEAIERAITPRTSAIMPVHFAGAPCDMDAIEAIAQDTRAEADRGRGPRGGSGGGQPKDRLDRRLHLLFAVCDQEPCRR